MTRYTFQEKFVEIGDKAADMRKKTVMIIGAGGLGSTVADMLHREGINIRVVDKGRILIDELQRQSLYEEDEDSKFKAKQIKKKLENVNFKNKVRTFHEELVKENAFLMDSADVVIDCSNNLETMELVGKYVKKKISLISCKYAGSEGVIFISGRKHYYKDVTDKMAKVGNIEEKGIINAGIHFAAGIIVSETLKSLLGKETSDNLITYNIWDNKIRKSNL
jgi:molybdopterin/thiamine biosynthesis adenylyltransferase